MKKIIVIMAIILLTNIAYAIQNINLTFDGNNDICITDNMINESCNMTQILTLDGTDDHFIYFVPKTYISDDMTTENKIKAILLNPILMVSGIGFLLIILASGYLFTRFVSAIGGRK